MYALGGTGHAHHGDGQVAEVVEHAVGVALQPVAAHHADDVWVALHHLQHAAVRAAVGGVDVARQGPAAAERVAHVAHRA